MLQQSTNSAYLRGVKSWKLRNMAEGYLRARLACQKLCYDLSNNGKLPAFEALQDVSQILAEVKDHHHLVFRRSEELDLPQSQHKLIPGYAETAFIDHVGLLFHKVMIACELRYILQRYAHDEKEWQRTYDDLLINLTAIRQLFDEGAKTISDLMRTHADNPLMLAFLYENYRWVAKTLHVAAGNVVEELFPDEAPAELYYRIARYYHEGGWNDQAHGAAKRALAHDKNHTGAAELKRTLKILGKGGLARLLSAAAEKTPAATLEN